MTLTPGIYEMAEDAYHADPCEQPSLSASIAKVLLAQSPLHAYWQHPKLNPDYRPTHSATFDLGTAVHDVFLRGLDTVKVINAPDWRTNDAKAARDAARDAGLIPMLAKDAERVQPMVAAIRDQIAARDDDPPLFDAAGKPEQTIIWEESGVLCRARLDWLHDSLACIDDLKSTGVSANPHDWGRRTFWSIGGDIQARFYQRGIHALTGTTPKFRFAVAETARPHGLSVLDLSSSAVELADQKIDTAVGLWKRCLETGIWPGYSDQVASIEVGWQATDFVERHWQDNEVAA